MARSERSALGSEYDHHDHCGDGDDLQAHGDASALRDVQPIGDVGIDFVRTRSAREFFRGSAILSSLGRTNRKLMSEGVAIVEDSERTTEDGAHVVNVK